MVAVVLDNYKHPAIGEVIEKREKSIVLHYYKGSWNKKWVPWLTRGGQAWTDELPKDCIYLADFKLDQQSKLRRDTKRQMREFLSSNNVNND